VRKDKTIMGEMRKLGSLLHVARKISKTSDFTGNDMLRAKNFRTVVDALTTLIAKEDNGMKAGLKLSLGYLLKKAARFIKCELVIDSNKEEVKERDKFLSVLDGSWGYLFNSAQIQLESNRESCLRRPRSLPLESDIHTLHICYKLHKPDEYAVWTASEFIELWSLLVCRLTLSNSRRGGGGDQRVCLSPNGTTLKNTLGFLMTWSNMWMTHWRKCC